MSFERKINFPPSTELDWSKMASRELNDDDPRAKLSKTIAGISVKPYYDATDVPQKKIGTIKSEFFPWLNIPKISVEDSKYANKVALQHLNNGADGILFDLKSNEQPEQLLKGIELQHCYTFFIVHESALDFHNSFKSFVHLNNVSPNGGFYFEGESTFPMIKEFRSNGIVVQPKEHCIDQISSSLKVACSRIDQLTDSGVSPEKALHSIAFLWPARTEFFISISEMRAMRMCWNLFSKTYEVENAPLFLHHLSSVWTKESFQPHGNMIAQTSVGLSSILGCADAFTCEPEKEGVNMLARASRNISSVLKEESHLDKVADPTAGSYFIEATSVSLAEIAWKKFQEIV